MTADENEKLDPDILKAKMDILRTRNDSEKDKPAKNESDPAPLEMSELMSDVVSANKAQLPSIFRHDDVRYSESLVEYFLREFTSAQDVVFDPFAGFGTTLLVAQAMHRIPYGIELEPDRGRYIQSKLDVPTNLIIGDARQLLSYNLPSFDFSMTSPPYMGEGDEEDPLTAYSSPGEGYQAYLSQADTLDIT